jgi:gas vesicle protein
MGHINEGSDYSVGTAAFIAGALIGAGVALLLAPQSGADTRNMLRDYAGRAKDELKERGKEAKATVDSALERGKEAYESVKDQSKKGYESAKQTFRDVGNEARNRVS